MTLGLRTRIGSRPHRVVVQNPGTPQPDGDGGYITKPVVSPLPWFVSIVSAQASDLQNAVADTVLATKIHIIRGQYRNDITTKSQLVFTDLDGNTRTFDIDGVDNLEQRNFELVLSCTELEGGTPPEPAPPPDVLDDFNRPDENPLSNSGMWQKPPVFDLPLHVVAHQAASPQTGQGGMFWMTPFAGDFDISVTVPVLPDVGTSSQFGLALLPDAVSAPYVMAVMLNQDPPAVLIDMRGFARPQTPIPGAFVAGDTIRLSRTGTHYIASVRLEGIWYPLVDAVDPATPGPLYAGIWIQNYVSSALTRFDDFAVVQR